MFSILMCTYNSETTVGHALDSVLSQSCGDWELIILDNGSKDNTVNILKGYETRDKRIRCLYRTNNVGWCKGISLCLEVCTKSYMMFLGADDFLYSTDTLQDIKNEIIEYTPDVVWTGFAEAQYMDGSFTITGISETDTKRYSGVDKPTEIYEVMSNIYYNSMMHYVKIDFLKTYGIDFFAPFYGDNQGMLEVLCRAERMSVIGKPEYILTKNSSQTVLAVNFDEDITQQWKCVRRVFVEHQEEFEQNKIIEYIANRILRDIVAMFEHIVLGEPLRDIYMNSLEVGLVQRFLKAEEWLSYPEMSEMFLLVNGKDWKKEMIGTAAVLYFTCMKYENMLRQMREESIWLAETIENEMIQNDEGEIEWKIDKIIVAFYELCITEEQMHEEERRLRFAELENSISGMSEDEIKKFIQEVFKNTTSENALYRASMLYSYMKIKAFDEIVISNMLRVDVDCLTRCMLEIQTQIKEIGSYADRRKLHQKNIKELWQELNWELPYIPVNKRNSKRIVLVTEQIINNGVHAPTIMVFSFITVLKKYLGYEVKLYALPSNKQIDMSIWRGGKSYKVGNYGKTKLSYEGIEVDFEEVCMIDIENYKRVLLEIYEWNPLFVLNLGVDNPVADLPVKFTTLVERNMISECPLSEGDILFRTDKKNADLETEYANVLESYQRQIFVKDRIPAKAQKRGSIYTRKELGLPEDKFLIAIVGTRLETELSKEFLDVLKDIEILLPNVAFVFIGCLDKSWENIRELFGEGKVYYLGYCPYLCETYAALDLYLNPKRLGGGFSAEMAMEAGLPIVTLPYCDVSYRAGSEFIVSDYEEMKCCLQRYASDAEFYAQKKQAVADRMQGSMEERLATYVGKMIHCVEDILYQREDYENEDTI